MLALKIATFLLSLSLGIIASALKGHDVRETPPTEGTPVDATLSAATPSHRATQPRPNCIDAVLEPKLRAARLKEFDRLGRKLDKLSREIKKDNTLKRDIEILDETIKIQKEINELEQASDSTYTKLLYLEICYQ